MYTPAHFASDDDAVAALIAAHPLAQLVVATPEGLLGTPVPLLRRGQALVGHLARANELWRYPGPALAIFTGPQAYVSPGWLASKQEHGKVVPTWNYESVHVLGTLVVHDETEWKRAVVTQLTDFFEAPRAKPWQVADAPADYIEASLRNIVGIELVDLRSTGKAKLSQNRTAADRQGVITGLSDGTAAEQALADRMRGSAMPDSGS
ncbi:MAG: FMN-binding negative transcriptional regulator [Ilumatobacteraceae bacterium]